MKPLLSILICTTVDRQEMFRKLYNKVYNQCTHGEAEVLFAEDNKEISVGRKRQILLEEAAGDFVVSIDSDDDVPDYYVEEILKAIKENPDIDCIGFRIQCEGCEGVTANASMKYDDWHDKTDGFDYVRHTYHKTPVRREHALAVGFEDMRFGEDYKYSMGLKNSGLLKSEAYIGKIMYIYKYKYENPETKYGVVNKTRNSKRKY